jgi:hypothetical protein
MKMIRILYIIVLFGLGCSAQGPAPSSQRLSNSSSPYPPSPVIESIHWDFDRIIKQAAGSDNWPVTWADDDHQYTSWGDGGGFGGTNVEGRVSLGIARIEGDADRFRGFNLWGGKEPVVQAQFGGKSYGILFVKGVLYMWILPGSDTENYQEARLAVSRDRGLTWTKANWSFEKSEGIVSPTFCQFGRDYDGARDQYVYIYFVRLKDDQGLKVQKPGQIDLARVDKAKILDRSAYEFFVGLTETGQSIWTGDFSRRKPVFEDPNGVGWSLSVSYNVGLGRYFLMTEHEQSFEGHLGVFDAPEPWGPWTTVGYYSGWGGFKGTFFWNVSNKWLEDGGKLLHVIFTGTGRFDSFNLIRGRITLKT